MFSTHRDALEDKPRLYRYFFYLITGCRYSTFAAWQKDGEPNPFVHETRRVRVTHEVEIRDIFAESLGRR